MGITTETYGEDTLDEGAIRAAFQEVVAADGRPLARIAPGTGVNYSTLSAWNAGNYRGDNARITADVARWLNARKAKERTRGAIPPAPDFMMTPTAEAIINILEAAQALPDIAVIAGGAGIGKTSAAHYYRKQSANVWLVTLEPAVQTMGALVRLICDELGIPDNKNTSYLSEAIRRRLTNTNGLLILDEAQNMRPEFVDQVRAYHDRAGIGIVMMGNQTVVRRFGADRMTDAHAPLFSRVGQRFSQARAVQKDLVMFVEAWKLTDDGARKAAIRIGRSAGALRVMTKVLRMAFLLSHAEGRSEPNQSDIETAYEQLSHRAEGGAA